MILKIILFVYLVGVFLSGLVTELMFRYCPGFNRFIEYLIDEAKNQRYSDMTEEERKIIEGHIDNEKIKTSLVIQSSLISFFGLIRSLRTYYLIKTNKLKF